MSIFDTIRGVEFVETVPMHLAEISKSLKKISKNMEKKSYEDLHSTVYAAVVEFAANHYGETEDDASYCLSALADEITEAIADRR